MTGRGTSLEDALAELAERNGWIVEKRKRRGARIPDLVLRRGGVVLVVQVKDKEATPRDASQTRRDLLSYLEWLLEKELGIQVRGVLVARDFTKGTRARASRYGVMCYRVDEVASLLR